MAWRSVMTAVSSSRPHCVLLVLKKSNRKAIQGAQSSFAQIADLCFAGRVVDNLQMPFCIGSQCAYEICWHRDLLCTRNILVQFSKAIGLFLLPSYSRMSKWIGKSASKVFVAAGRKSRARGLQRLALLCLQV